MTKPDPHPSSAPPEPAARARRAVHWHAPHIHVSGPWPFITRLSYTSAGRHFLWLARAHRKGLDRGARGLEASARPFWQTQGYNWSVGATFAVGAFLFMLGSVLSLLPASASLSSTLINIIFFAGSIPFTIAAYLQHFQAANASAFAVEPPRGDGRRPVALMGWHPHSAGWLSTFTQLIGTLAFNLNTWDGIQAPSGWLMQNLWLWTPDMVGSALFLISGYLAFLETSHGYWSWRPRELSWQIVFVNLLGCIAFMIAAVLAYVPQTPEAAWIIALSNGQLLLGSLGFFVGAVLTMRESAAAL